MAFAGATGIELNLDDLTGSTIGKLFNEELGAVIQVRSSDLESVYAEFAEAGLAEALHAIGHLRADDQIVIRENDQTVLEASRDELRREWSETTWRMQRLRDDPTCADEEQAARCDLDDPGLSVSMDFDLAPQIAIAGTARPQIAILREQGVNGQVEMAAAFDRAGFDSIDVHMSDLMSGETSLDAFQGLVACGGFSYGDVLGAGGGWAKSIGVFSLVAILAPWSQWTQQRSAGRICLNRRPGLPRQRRNRRSHPWRQMHSSDHRRRC